MDKKAIYITRQGASLRRLDGCLAVAIDGATVDRWPLDELGQIFVFGNVQVTTQAIALALANGVHVSFFSSRGRYRGQLTTPASGNVFVRLAQVSRHREDSFRLEWGRRVVGDKIREARACLLRFRRNHPDASEPLERAAKTIRWVRDKLLTASDVDTLMGYEGHAAAAYFGVFDVMLRGPLTFERRSQHPAHNEVNALLNLGYTLLANEIAGWLEAAGFDPRVGLYHGVRYGRMSLALDLLEAYRVPVVDRMVVASINRRMLGADDFVRHPDQRGVRLKNDALQRFLAIYEEALGPPVSGARKSPRASIRDRIWELHHAVLHGFEARAA